MQNIKLTLEYDGSQYHGWQFQENALSVQEVLSGAIKKLTGEDILLNGAGRTDAGAHAFGQVASFKTESKIPVIKFIPALNQLLPMGISIINSEVAEDDFHARFSAKGKHYRYLVLNRHERSPHFEDRAWHVRDKLDIKAMEKSASYFLGTHNFKAFCAAGHHIKSFERTISLVSWKQDGDILQFDTMGNGFLYKMVRIMVGTMVDIGRGRISPGTISEAILSGNRDILGLTAPALGLYLVEVLY